MAQPAKSDEARKGPDEAKKPQLVAENAGAGDSSDDKETAGRALTQIAIVAVICGAIFAAYYFKAKRNYESKTRVMNAAAQIDKADLASLTSTATMFTEALDFDSSSKRAISGLAFTYATRWTVAGDDTARTSATEWLSKAQSEKIETAERFAAEILVLTGDGKFAEAEQLAVKVVERGANDDKVYWALGNALWLQGKVRVARENLRRASELGGSVAHYAALAGDAYDVDGELRTAKLLWTQAAKANVLYLRGVARDISGRVRSGEPTAQLAQTLARLDAETPDRVSKWDRSAIEQARAELAFRAGKNEDALKAYDAAIKAGGDRPELLAGKARVLLVAGRAKEGVALLETAHKALPQARGILFALTEAYAANDQGEKALALLKAQTEMADEHGYHARLGEAYTSIGKFAEAKTSYMKAMELKSDSADGLVGLARLAWKQKKYDDAREGFERALQAKQIFPEVYMGVGLMFTEMGAPTDGSSQLSMAEQQMKRQGWDTARMQRFYGDVLKAMGNAKKADALVKEWQARWDAYRTGA